jgi:hypothetical protein
MSVQARGRSAANSLLNATHTELEIQVMLEHLHEARTPRVSSRAVALTVLVAIGFIIATFGWAAVRPHASAPASPPTSSATDATVHTSFALAVPFTADVPKSWTQAGHPGISTIIASPGGPYVGVGIDPTPIAGHTTKGAPADPVPAKLTAQSLADWVAKRPYLQPTNVVATTLSGLPAWRVDVRLKDTASATATCDYNTDSCVPMIALPTLKLPLGPSHGAVGRIFFVQMPNGRIVGVNVSGAGADNLDGLLAATQPVIDSIQLNAK